MKVSESTNVQMPLKTVVSLITLVAVGTWAYFGIIERLNSVETRVTLSEADLTKNTEFRIKWPRGELGSLPADSEQFMLIEHMAGMLDKIEKQMEEMKFNQVNIKRLQEDMIEARENIEELKDKVRENGSH